MHLLKKNGKVKKRKIDNLAKVYSTRCLISL